MKKKLNIFIISSFCILLSCSNRSVADKNILQGINNKKVLPMLKHLSYSHGGMNIPIEDGRFLYDLIIKQNYKRGLEIGTSNGYSTLWIGLAFKKNSGKIITIEIDPLRANEARDNFKKAGLHEVIDSRINDALTEIKKIEGTFDFVFIDAWKNDYIKYLNLLKIRVKKGGAIVAHNVLSHSYSMRDFLEAVKNDPQLETRFYNTSSAGISVSFVK